MIGMLWGTSLPAAFSGWLLAGPVAIGVLAEFTRVDTQRRPTRCIRRHGGSQPCTGGPGSVSSRYRRRRLAYRDLAGRL
ncbi:hypothetical protein BZL30_9393 [Mycobacterium kansasii]|uniref:Uncharacterized protein n=1 Tax=Mycobacterium kansasii TaxID=1768 RepID=A0A1V3WAH1_MYCKA|nr:hypothetical protein BZL30_9393 [Mycobacterium kansasii]